MRFTSLIAFALLATALAGCSDDGPGEVDEMPMDEVEATSTTGGIRGVVVDQAINPVVGADIRVLNTELATTTDASGAFVVSGLEAGSYFVVASHPLYDEVQQGVDVIAGVKEPKAVKFQLTRMIEAEPYMTTEKYTGFIACSAGLPNIGYSEECGEGVGVPGVGRIGGQDQNMVQFDFTVAGPSIRTLIVEQAWQPTSGDTASGQLRQIVATDWSCDPFCSGNRMMEAGGPPNLLLRADADVLDARELTSETVISSFTWADADQPNVILNQEFELFVSAFYYLEAPPEWSFVAGDPDPFRGD